MVESTIRYSKSGSSDIASKIRRQTPLMLHRLKRRNTLFQSPNVSGRSRQGEPVRTIHSTPSTNIRLSRPVEPLWSGRPMISGDIRSPAAALKTTQGIVLGGSMLVRPRDLAARKSVQQREIFTLPLDSR